MKVRIEIAPVYPEEKFPGMLVVEVFTWELLGPGTYGWDFANVFDFDSIDELDLNGIFQYCFFYEEDMESSRKFDAIVDDSWGINRYFEDDNEN